MKKLIIFCCLSFSLNIIAKTTYIPTYISYMHIISGRDTSSVTNNLPDLELAENNGLFTLRIEHEVVTKEKVKEIKKAKRTAGWMTFYAVMTGVSAAFSQNNLQMFMRLQDYDLAKDLTGLLKINAESEQTLSIFLWIDNNTNDELIVNDMERGLVWCILPNESLRLKINNPEASRLRISNPKNDFVRYASIVTGSKIAKYELVWEDDNVWMISDNYLNQFLVYKRKNKSDFKETKINKEELDAYIKEQKEKMGKE